MGSPKNADDFKSVCKQDCKAANMFEYFNQGLTPFVMIYLRNVV